VAKSDDKIFAAIAHIAIFFDLVGLIIAVIIYALKGKESPFISFSSKQAIGWQVFALIIHKVVMFFTMGSFIGGMRIGINPLRGFFGMFTINGLVSLIFIVVAIMGAIKALNGEKYQYPLIGDFIAKI